MEEEKKFYEYLEELRKRVLKSLAVIAIFSILVYAYKEKIVSILVSPLNQKLVFLSPTEPLVTLIKLSFLIGLIIAFPYVIYQIWSFISEIFDKKSRKKISKYIFFSIALFYSAIIFCYTIILPFTLNFLINLEGLPLIQSITFSNYIDFSLYLMLIFGIMFQFPIILLFLVELRIVSLNQLRKKRAYFILGIFVFAAILTPTPDAFTQILLAIPLWFLFEITLIIIRLNRDYKKIDNSD